MRRPNWPFLYTYREGVTYFNPIVKRKHDLSQYGEALM